MLNLGKIKQLARKKGISLVELSVQLGMSKQSLFKIIRENTTKISTLEQIANYFGVPINYFFDDYEEKQNQKELTDQERNELGILRERVQSLIIARDALQEQVRFLHEQIQNLKNNAKT